MIEKAIFQVESNGKLPIEILRSLFFIFIFDCF